jgi:dTDP-4-amino-4,6-dideoxygalactose transaminase
MPSATLSVPAIAGGRPIFDQLLPIALPEGISQDHFLRDVRRIFQSRRLTNGSFVRELETAAEAYLKVPHCVAVSNCTAGLMLILKALDLRGEVILPSFTFHATAHALVWNGLRPVFADCDPNTLCLDPRSVRDRISPNTAALLAVHLFGNPAPVRELETIAADLSLPLVFDAAHAFGTCVNGLRVGGFGRAEVFSFSPTKLVVGGEGGLIATRDGELAGRLRAARNYGDAGTGDPEMVGLNARMSEFHAALALRAMDGADSRIARRNEIRLRYERRLQLVPGLSFQRIRAETRSSCKDFSVIVDEGVFGRQRDWLFQLLQKENIDARRYFWPPVHRQRMYRQHWDGRPLPVTEYVSDRVLSLPIYSSLRDEEIDKVCEAILRASEFAKRTELRAGMAS